MAIPKRIFYIWIGSPRAKVESCINSWRELMPDYEVINAHNSAYFNMAEERASCHWFDAVCERKLYAFMSDYMRIKILMDYGGLYCDTDITAVKRFDYLLDAGFFAGFESPTLINVAVCGGVAGHPVLRDMYEFYQNEIWKSPLYTIPEIATWILTRKYGALEFDSAKYPIALAYGDIVIHPRRTFYPFYYNEKFDKKLVTPQTFAIHWWDGSWSGRHAAWLENKHLPDGEKSGAMQCARQTVTTRKVELILFGIKIAAAHKKANIIIFSLLGRPVFAWGCHKGKRIFRLLNFFRKDIIQDISV